MLYLEQRFAPTGVGVVVVGDNATAVDSRDGEEENAAIIVVEGSDSMGPSSLSPPPLISIPPTMLALLYSRFSGLSILTHAVVHTSCSASARLPELPPPASLSVRSSSSRGDVHRRDRASSILRRLAAGAPVYHIDDRGFFESTLVSVCRSAR